MHSFGDPLMTYCIDPATYHVLTAAITMGGAEISSFEFDDYATSGSVQYPQTIKVNYAGKPLVSGKMTISRTEKFADALFAAPEKATSMDFASCPMLRPSSRHRTWTNPFPQRCPMLPRRPRSRASLDHSDGRSGWIC